MIKQERLSAAAASNNNLPPDGLAKNRETNQSDWSLKTADRRSGDIENNLTVTRV